MLRMNEKGDNLLPLIFNFAADYVTTKVKPTRRG
jgi:hypothetical protein